MAEQAGIEPSATVAPLTKNCWADYKTPQEFADALAEVLQISAAAGEQGLPGEDASAEPVVYGMVLVKEVSVPVGVDRVDTGINLHGKVVQIVVPSGGVDPGYDEVIAPGMIIDDDTLILAFNSPNDGTPAAPLVQQAGWVIRIYEVGEVES